MMKINLSSIVLSCLFWSASHAAPLVVISQVVNHPALDRTVQGIVDGLSDYARENKTALEVRIESAQNSTSLAAQIAAKAVSQNASCSVGVGTLSAQSFSKYARKGQTKLIFSSVTDPMNAQLINSYQEPGFNTSGVSNFIDVDPQLDLFLKVQPHLKKLGFIYNTGEANSVSLEKVIDMACQKRGIQLVSQVATRSQDIAQITQKLAQEVDAIFISNDSTALSALSVIIQQASAMHVPVYVSDIDSVSLGAIAALGPDQYEIGQQTARMIEMVLKGENPGRIPVEFPQKTQCILNEDAAAKLGVQFSEELLAKADAVLRIQPAV